MFLTFKVRFRAQSGQSLWVTGDHKLLGNGDPAKALPMQHLDDEFWQTTLEFQEGQEPEAMITYNYLLREVDGTVIYDSGNDKRVNPARLAAGDTRTLRRARSRRGNEAEETPGNHSASLAQRRQLPDVVLADSWNSPARVDNTFYTEPFTNVLLPADSELHGDEHEKMPSNGRPATHLFKVKAPLLAEGQSICLLGGCSAFRNWNSSEPIRLERKAGEAAWSVELDLRTQGLPIEYKYGVLDARQNRFLRYEDGQNRVLKAEGSAPPYPDGYTIVDDGFVELPATTWKGAGVAIPVFSIRTASSLGVGEFLDIKPLVDWCRRVGLKLIQVLPINDTTATHTWADSYPYSAISAFALHPLYLNLQKAADGSADELLEALEPERKRLNSLPALDYESVMKAKLDFLKKIFPLQKDRIFQSRDYRAFFRQNKHWLVPYAAFCELRDEYGSADYTKWPGNKCWRPGLMERWHEAPTASEAVAVPDTPESAGEDGKVEAWNTGTDEMKEEVLWSDVAKASPPAEAELHRGAAETESSSQEASRRTAFGPEFHYFVQYHLHAQLREVADYAHKSGVILKGDLAIGVFRHGADAWQNPELYNMDVQAGAPPDPFADKGQNWSFPTYNWPLMKQTGFSWWKQRFAQMGCYFDAFRVDHILGFFRIWSIPIDAVEGILGYFVPALPVLLSEFQQHGIQFEKDRYTQPFINDRVLWELFGAESAFIKGHFIDAAPVGSYRLKPEFATQRQVEAQFNQWDDSDHNRKLKAGLFDLISNVILFEVPGSQGQAFHFRFFVEKTSSFKNLDLRTQAQLKELYIDYFFRRQDEFWRKEGLQKLPPLKRETNMLVCGEDLGLVPTCVPEVMKQLGLLSLEVQRMPKAMGREFSRPAEAPYLSVVTPSTHDMSTIRGWWEEDRGVAQRFYNRELGRPGQAPGACEPWINRMIVEQHLASPAMWTIFQLQDLLGLDPHLRHPNPWEERINVPANPKHYWRYRMHLPVERLLHEDQFNSSLKDMIARTGR
jgi:4-alpha-glucanotransferase